MRVVENHCVDCGLPCLGDSCPYIKVPVYYCNVCKEVAEYRIDNEDLCRECAESQVNEIFDNLTLAEKAKLLDVDFHRIDE